MARRLLSAMDVEKRFLSGFIDDLNANRVTLPSLPEVAMRVRNIIEDPKVTPAKIEIAVSADPALTARLLKVVNSPAYRGATEITHLRMAITRLGPMALRNLTLSLAMEQLYQARGAHPSLRQHLHEVWQHSVQVATLSHAFARKFTTLAPDQALLAGLVHDIGKLPVLSRAELEPELLEDEEVLKRVARRLHTTIGPTVLDEWHFPKELVAVTAEHEAVQSSRTGPVDYVDVVIVANLHSYLGNPQRLTEVDWNQIPAFGRLGLTPGESVAAMEEAREELKEIQALFGM
ncbi:MAG TPA: HDOD domain-containing protein [Gammaproteobacteria bacterium]|nr:HDOD domain-containing protein [Gammaproteobacteria bacterium]